MELIFFKVGEEYVAEFMTTANINIHIEKNNAAIKMFQKTLLDAKYSHISEFDRWCYNSVIDVDICGAIYPKYIRIVCTVEPTMAEVTCPDGEVTIIEQGAKLIKFNISATEFTAEEGMTWEQWTRSEYNSWGFHVQNIGGDTDYISADDSLWNVEVVANEDESPVSPSDVIKNGVTYSYVTV